MPKTYVSVEDAGRGRKKVNRTIVTDRDELTAVMDDAKATQAELDAYNKKPKNPKLKRKHKFRLTHCVPVDAHEEAVLLAEQDAGGLLGDVAKGQQHLPVEEVLASKTWAKFMDI